MSALEKDAWRITFAEVKAAAEDIIEEARKGRMFILVDDEDRENEGDVVIPAQWATPEVINFMAKHARGLICLTLTRERCERLQLPPVALVAEERTLKGSYVGSCVPSRDIPRYVELHRQGRLPVERLLSETIALDDINEAFDRMVAGDYSKPSFAMTSADSGLTDDA